MDGRFEYEVPAFLTSESDISLTICEGKNYNGEFSVGAEDGSRIKGVATTNNRRIVLAKDKFSGSTSKIIYGIDTQGLTSGDQITGDIVLSGNIGELIIPVTADIVEAEILTSKTKIRTLCDFAALAMKNSREAFRLFTNEHFIRLLKGEDSAYGVLYRGMSHNPVTYQHMEEFLIAARKKEPVILSLDQDKKGIYQINHSQKDSFFIYKSTWGYVRMEIEVVGDFLEVEKKVVSTDDFIGKVYRLEYVVKADKLGQGKRFGKIVVHNVHQTLEFNIEASLDRGGRLFPTRLKEQKTMELMQDYLKLQLHRMDYRTWLDKSLASLKELASADCMDPMLTFYETYLYYINEDLTRAMEVLWNFKERSEPATSPREQGIYCFLAKNLNLLEPERQYIYPKIRAYVQEKPDDYYLMKILMEEDEAYQHAPYQQLRLLEHTYECGCRSPLLYLDAWQLLKQQEGLLRRFSPFMIQTLNFAQKQNVLDDSLLKRAAFLSDNLKGFHNFVYRLLCTGYESFPGDEVLEAICKLIMKGTPAKKEYFRWYSLAVERELRITRLYEYYIESIDEGCKKVLPQVIRMYFAYNNTLSDRKKAFIYANVIQNKGQDQTTYLSYRSDMEEFAKEKVLEGKINENYALIYQEFLTEVDSVMLARALLGVMFIQKVGVKDKNIRNVVVCHKALVKEQVYPVSEQCAYVNIYSQDARILLEDAKLRRYGTTIPFTVEKLMDEEKLAHMCGGYGFEHPGLLLHLCQEQPSQMEVNRQNLSNYWLTSKSDAFTREYKDAVRKSILDYLAAHPKTKGLKEYFRGDAILEYAKINRSDTIAVLTRHEMYEEAFLAATRLGIEGVDSTVLLILADSMIQSMEGEKDEELIYLADYVTRQNKYNETVLEYLCRYYTGSVAQMTDLWKKVKGFDIDSYKLDERILIFSMYVRSFPQQQDKILDSYVMQQGKQRVIAAYLTYIAYAYFMEEKGIDSGCFMYLEKTCERGWEMDIVCRLALLKYYSTCNHLTREQENLIEKILSECDQKGLRFAFFKKLPSHLTESCQVEDKVFIEERFHQGSRVVLHYSLRQNDKEPAVYKSEPMREMYQGIFTKEFLLFYGEILDYYLSVEKEGAITTTPKKRIVLHDVEADGRTRYRLLNQILAFRSLGNKDAMNTALKTYLEQEIFATSAFELMD